MTGRPSVGTMPAMTTAGAMKSGALLVWLAGISCGLSLEIPMGPLSGKIGGLPWTVATGETVRAAHPRLTHGAQRRGANARHPRDLSCPHGRGAYVDRTMRKTAALAGLVLVTLFGASCVGGYNKLVAEGQAVDAQWAQV